MVLRYRVSAMCFAMIDLISTAFSVITGFVGAARFHDIDRHGMRMEGIWAIVNLIFLIGPICGLVGANRLNQSLVAVYLAFCVVKTVNYISLAFLSPWLWYLFIALIQFWVTDIVFKFWRALRALTPAQKAELLNPTRVADRLPRQQRPGGAAGAAAHAFAPGASLSEVV